MTINGSTNSNAWTYKLEVQEIDTSIQDRTSTVRVQVYLGRANSTSYLGGDYSVTVNCGEKRDTQNGNISYPTYISGGDWLLLKTFTFVVANENNPTIISISSTFSSGDFTPSYASASGTMQLTILHLNPVINTATMVEFNQALINLNVPDTTVVTNLSQKRITLSTTTYDEATPSYRLENYNTNYNLPLIGGYQASNIFNADYKKNPVFIDSNGKAKIVQRVKDSMNGTASNWLYVDINGTLEEPNAIPYTEPIIERTSTNIKRKSGVYSETLQRIANLTDNIVSLNLKGNIYKVNDIIGNNNSITQIGYKIWATDDTEPQNYTSLSSSATIDSSGNITINDFEIANILFTKVYNYKIILKDFYNKETTIDNGIVPTGQPVWSEYSDHIDFLKLTVKGYNPFEYSENETICGVWLDKPLYRKVIDIGYLPDNSYTTTNHNISNILTITRVIGVAIRNSDKDTLPIPYVTFNANNNGGITIYANDTSITIGTTTDRSAYNGYIVLEYTKTTD